MPNSRGRWNTIQPFKRFVNYLNTLENACNNDSEKKLRYKIICSKSSIQNYISYIYQKKKRSIFIKMLSGYSSWVIELQVIFIAFFMLVYNWYVREKQTFLKKIIISPKLKHNVDLLKVLYKHKAWFSTRHT